jgi:hypothetical protein
MWNVEQVAERFREAAETARRLPPRIGERLYGRTGGSHVAR